MSEYTFKNLNEIDTVEEPADGTTMMGFENGTPIQMPMSAVKGGGGVYIVPPWDGSPPVNNVYDNVDQGNAIKEALLAGKLVWFNEKIKATTTSDTDDNIYSLVTDFNIKQTTSGDWQIILFGINKIFPITVEE